MSIINDINDITYKLHKLKEQIEDLIDDIKTAQHYKKIIDKGTKDVYIKKISEVELTKLKKENEKK